MYECMFFALRGKKVGSVKMPIKMFRFKGINAFKIAYFVGIRMNC